MLYRNAMYAYNPIPSYKLGVEEGKILVGPHPDKTGWSDGFQSTMGSINLSEKKLRKAELCARIFLDFHTIVVASGLDPQVVHKEFLKIDEYRQFISLDIEGAEQDSD